VPGEGGSYSQCWEEYGLLVEETSQSTISSDGKEIWTYLGQEIWTYLGQEIWTYLGQEIWTYLGQGYAATGRVMNLGAIVLSREFFPALLWRYFIRSDALCCAMLLLQYLVIRVACAPCTSGHYLSHFLNYCLNDHVHLSCAVVWRFQSICMDQSHQVVKILFHDTPHNICE
jgi:hypothetical protein